MAAYAEAYLGKDAAAPADAITVSPYLGLRVAAPGARPRGRQTGRGRLRAGADLQPGGPHRAARRAARTLSVAASWSPERRGRQRGRARARRARQRRAGRRRHRRGRRPASSASTWPARTRPCWRPASGAQGGTAEDLRRVFGDALPRCCRHAAGRSWRRTDVAALRDRATADGGESLRELIRSRGARRLRRPWRARRLRWARAAPAPARSRLRRRTAPTGDVSGLALLQSKVSRCVQTLPSARAEEY